MNDVDKSLADAGHPIGMTSQRPVELVVENKKERHGISTQIKFLACGMGKAQRRQLRHVPHRKPGQRLPTGHQTQPLNPLEAVVTCTV